MNTILLNLKHGLLCFCPLCLGSEVISWLWFTIAVVAVFFLGWLWYNFFTERWVKAVKYGKCACGADMEKGEKCTCKPTASAFLPMIVQLLATILIGFMYFILAPLNIWLAILVAVAICGWMKSSIIFQTPEKQRRFDRILIDVGYFAVSSAIFIGLALI
jgi:hypothetical protein